MRSKLFVLFSLLVIAAMVLTACGPTTTPTPEVQVVEKTVVNTVVVEKEGQTIVVTATPEPAAPAKEFSSKDPTTFVYATAADPDTLDPAFDYESQGIGILAQLYDTLIDYKKESPVEFVPELATEVPSLDNGGISADGLTVTFKIRSGIKFHDGTDMTVDDVAYTFQRGLLQGGTQSPQWLFAEPILGVGTLDVADLVDPKYEDDPENLAKADPAKLKTACETVVNKIVADKAAGTVTFKLAQPWGPFLATFPGGWGSITSKTWMAANGAWDGSCDTWQTYYGKNPEQLNKLKIGTGENGTGPYKLDHWTPGEEFVMNGNDAYWLTTPLWDGGPSGAPAMKKLIYKIVTEFNTRLAMLQAGDADSIDLGSSENWPIMDTNVGEFCDYVTQKCEPSGTPDEALRRWTNYTTGTRTDVFFTFKVNTEGGNNFIGSGKLDGNGVPPDFFNDVHIRRAFNYCFDFDTYLKDVLQGEGVRSKTAMLPGMLGYDENAPFYGYDLKKCEEEFKASTWKSADGKQLWDVGFRLTMAYNVGNTQRQTIGEILQANLIQVNPLFTLETIAMPWPTLLSQIRASKAPLFTIGWIMDMYETHNWVIPYTTGTYGVRQQLPADIMAKYSEINSKAVTTADPKVRDQIYKTEFNPLFYDTCQGIILFLVNGRHYEPRYMQDWFFNPIYAADNYYTESKK